MDRRKFVFGAVAGSSALFSLTGHMVPSLSSTASRINGRVINQSEFERMVSYAAKNKEHIFLPPGSRVNLSKPTKVDVSINGQGSHFYLEQNAQIILKRNQSQDIHLRNFRILSPKTTAPLITISKTQDVLLENIEMQGEVATPINISDAQNIQVIRSKVHFSGQSGATIHSSRDICFQNNIFIAKELRYHEQDFLRLENVGEAHILDNLFKSKSSSASLSFVGQPADQNSLVKNNQFLA